MLLEYRDVYAGGRLVGSGSADVITIVNPATEEVTGAVPSMVERDVEVAVSAARRAFDDGGWPLLPPAERAAALDRLAAALEARAEDTARLVTAEMGMPITLSRRSNVSVPCAIIRYYAALACSLTAEEVREAISFTGRTVVRREPAGVAAVIASWSYPLILAFCQLAPALAAGCTVVLLPAPETSLSAYILAEAFEAAEFPPGVFNLVTGTAEVGEMLAAHPGVDTVAVAWPDAGRAADRRHLRADAQAGDARAGRKVGRDRARRRGLVRRGHRTRLAVLRQLRAGVLHHVPGAGSLVAV